jgi:membrane-associated phospholipid phosphatase
MRTLHARLAAADLWRFGLLFLAPALTLIALAEEVGEREPLRFDRLLVPGAGPLHFEPLAVLLGVFTAVGGSLGVTVLASVPTGYLLSRRRYAAAAFIPMVLAGAFVISRILKDAFGRPRPPYGTDPLPPHWQLIVIGMCITAICAAWRTRWRKTALFSMVALAMMATTDLIMSSAIHVSNGADSFPSGHAVGSMSLACALIAVSWRTRRRWLVFVAGVIFAALVGVSRLFFGVHYASDVFAGWLLAVAWTALIARVFRPWLKREIPARTP